MHNSFIRKYGYLRYLLYILPSLIAFFIFGIYPNLQVFPLAFYKWNGVSKTKTFVGWQNFTSGFSDPNFTQVLLNTIFYVLFLFLVQTVVSIVLAITLKKNTTHNKYFRTLFFLPLVFSTVMVGLTWGYMYDPNLGVLNQLLVKIDLKNFDGFDWLIDPTRAIFSIVLVHIWHNIGYPITILTAGLQTIPETLYEAANVEGANSAQSFSFITLPLLLPTLLRITLLTFATGAMAFDYVFIIGSTGAATRFDTLAVSMYRGLTGQNLGAPATMGVILGILLFMVFMVQYVITKKVEDAIN